MWPQAAGELSGFANHLVSGNAGLTAAQIRMAIQLGDEIFAQKIKDKIRCPVCGGNGFMQNPSYTNAIISGTQNSHSPYCECAGCDGCGWKSFTL